MIIASTITTATLEQAKPLVKPGEHLIASVRGTLPGPTPLILGGIHENATALSKFG